MAGRLASLAPAALGAVIAAATAAVMAKPDVYLPPPTLAAAAVPELPVDAPGTPASQVQSLTVMRERVRELAATAERSEGNAAAQTKALQDMRAVVAQAEAIRQSVTASADVAAAVTLLSEMKDMLHASTERRRTGAQDRKKLHEMSADELRQRLREAVTAAQQRPPPGSDASLLRTFRDKTFASGNQWKQALQNVLVRDKLGAEYAGAVAQVDGILAAAKAT
jgi:hypothetical protein